MRPGYWGFAIIRIYRSRVKYAALVALDALATAVSLVAALSLRLNGDIPPQLMASLLNALPIVVAVSATVFHFSGLYRNVWRYVSIRDLWAIIVAVTFAIILWYLTLLIADFSPRLPYSVPIIQWFVLIVLLGCVRVARRVIPAPFRRAMGVIRQESSPTGRRVLIVGAQDQVEIALRVIEAGTQQYQPVGILENSGHDVLRKVRGVPILGTLDALEHVVEKLSATGQRPEAVILALGSEPLAGSQIVNLVNMAESLGLSVMRASLSASAGQAQSHELEVRPIELSALLGRPQANLDAKAIANSVCGRRVLVTGAGGTIGGELVRQIAAFGPAKVILLDSGEYNLYRIDLELSENFPDVPRVAVLCCIRQRERLMSVFEDHKPELVFHAAALKHVPLVEENPCEGVLTNVIGTRNVADAARLGNVLTMVQVSTDKAVKPVGVMGATKRLGELYCQAIDIAESNTQGAPRFLTVRFGNVLGSSGSLIPLFQRQLSRRAPLTVTHPEMTRYFMTAHEAVLLILQSTQRALNDGGQRGRIFVLDMGKPIKILDIAKNMIRLSGLEPGVDVKIKFVGLRPGERLHETLFDEDERLLPTAIPGVFEADPSPIGLGDLTAAFDRLEMASMQNDAVAVREQLAQVLSYNSNKEAKVSGTQASSKGRGTSIPTRQIGADLVQIA